jgi:uncharacterized protein YukE
LPDRAPNKEISTMSMYGANPEQLSRLGQTLNQQIDAVNGVMATVNGVLSGTTWEGPARQQFEQEWNGSFRNALNKLNEAFGLAGRDCVTRSQELQRVMG